MVTISTSVRLSAVALLAAGATWGCGSTSQGLGQPDDAGPLFDVVTTDGEYDDDVFGADIADAAANDGAIPPGGSDGTPVRQACTSKFGSGLSSRFGRLDGYLVSIVHPGTSGCNGDASHVHLQINMNSGIYDVAVNVQSNQGTGSAADVRFLDKPLESLPNGPWEEGWHTNAALDYVTDLGLHSGDFTATPLATLGPEVEGKLATVNHVSVFATGYGATGIHLVHRNATGQDGAIVMYPLSAQPEAMVFHFSNQSF